jgi:hypothetical protein
MREKWQITQLFGRRDARFSAASGLFFGCYDTGLETGFETDRDETQAVLLVRAWLKDQASERLREYEAKWPSSPASKRAMKFLADYRARFGCNRKSALNP